MSDIIADKLFLGDYGDAIDTEFLEKNNISVVINVADDVRYDNNNPNIELYHFPIEDVIEYNITTHFEEIFKLIDNNIKNKNILVHCHQGISRSATIIIAYLIINNYVNLKEAINYVLYVREIICPNKSFLKQLLQYELKILHKNSITYKELVKIFYNKK